MLSLGESIILVIGEALIVFVSGYIGKEDLLLNEALCGRLSRDVVGGHMINK